jgi:hypothetical protein
MEPYAESGGKSAHLISISFQRAMNGAERVVRVGAAGVLPR